MENRLAIVIVVDGLRASALGTYGNTSYPTPQLDELASRSLVVEWLNAKSPSLADFYCDVWNSFPQSGAQWWLFTDDSNVVPMARESFDQLQLIEGGRAKSARQIQETHTAKFFSDAVEHLALWHKHVTENRTGGLLWIHFSGMSGPWDAPLQLRDELMEDDDLRTPNFVVAPDSTSVDNPDELLAYRVAYAAQVAVLESCLAGFVGALEAKALSSQKQVMILGSRGFSLGEHGSVGVNSGALYGEQLHLPWLLLSETPEPLSRVQGFAQPADVGATTCDWLTAGDYAAASGSMSLMSCLSGESHALREIAISSNAMGELAIRTPAWMMKQGARVELYAKPDDRWEANDIASRCPEIVELLDNCLQANEANTPQPLPEELHSSWR